MKSAPIQWENGVFLAPQVFQQADRYLEAQLRFLRGAKSFGILHAELDAAALSLGKLRLLSCQAILPPPDGSTVDVPQVDTPPVEREFSLPSGTSAIEVFLTLPTASAPGRTQGREHAVTDVYDSNRQRTIKVLAKSLQLAVTGEPLNNLTVLKIAEVERHVQTGKPVLRNAFIPTCLAISAAPGLLNLVRDLLGKAEGLLRDLPAARRQRRRDDFDFLRALQGHAPAVRHLIEDAAEYTHPATLYYALLLLAGELQAFSDQALFWPRYDHGHLDRCFPQLCQILDGLLGCKPAPEDVRIVLHRKSRDSAFWRARLDPAPAADAQLLLALRGDLPAARIIAELEHNGKIAAGTKIVKATDDFAFAIPFRHESHLPERLLAQAGIYFSIDSRHELFAEVRKSGEIGVYIPTTLLGDREPEVEIIYVGGGRA